MKEFYAKSILLMLDIFAISLSLYLAYLSRLLLDDYFSISFNHSPSMYLFFPLPYIIILVAFFFEGIYTKRYDFWQESKQIFRSLGLSFLIIMSILALTHNIGNFSRAVIVFSFLYMLFIIPLFKNLSKKWLAKIGLWQREAKIVGGDVFLSKEIFGNPYLGYIKENSAKAQTVFINSQNVTLHELRQIISNEIQQHHEVIFIPLINDYDMTQSHIYELSNARTNLIVFQNRLKSRYRRVIQQGFNYFLAIMLLPFLLPMIAIIAVLIKSESEGPVFFVHERIGQNGKIIPTLKFRSMYKDAQKRLDKLLKNDPHIKDEWEKNFKLKDDPRVTKIGHFLRKTSLDELPQIFNVLKGEMHFVGPRPVVEKELELYYQKDAEYYFMVKPGITGLWQVSGRSDTDYRFRVMTDKWYVRNWSLWLDIIILFKTIKVVLLRKGAY